MVELQIIGIKVSVAVQIENAEKIDSDAGSGNAAERDRCVHHDPSSTDAVRRLGSGWSLFVEAQRSEAATYPDSQFPEAASALLDAERKAGFEEAGTHFVSGYFLTFLWLPPAEDAARTEA